MCNGRTWKLINKLINMKIKEGTQMRRIKIFISLLALTLLPAVIFSACISRPASQTAASATDPSPQQTVKPDYTAVLNQIKAHSGACYLADITQWLDENNLKWEACYNVSQERVDMTWEDGTTLLFLSSSNEDGSLNAPTLTMTGSSFDKQRFLTYYQERPDGASSSLFEKELWNMNQTDLAIARSEIYARHGMKFSDPFLQEVFNTKSWYQPLYDEAQFEEKESSLLNDREKEKLKAISEAEKERGFRFRSDKAVTRLRRLVDGSWISINGAGKEKKRISYGFDEWYDGPMQPQKYELHINMFSPYGGSAKGDLIDYDPVLYAASLDGATTQLFICGKNMDLVPSTDGYTLTDDGLHYIGSMTGSSTAGGAIEIAKDGIYVYGQGDGTQTSPSMAEYTFRDGKIIQTVFPAAQDPKDPSESDLTGFDMPKLFKQFLNGSLELKDPLHKNFPLSCRAEKGYLNKADYTFPGGSLKRLFALTDVNRDGHSELFYKVTAGPKEVMFLLGADSRQLKVLDVFDSRTRSSNFTVYNNGRVDCIQNDHGEQEVILRYDKKGRKQELIRFVSSEKWLKNADMSSGHYYEAYYLNGDSKNPVKLYSPEAYHEIRSQYLSDDVKEIQWYNLADAAN